MQINIWNLILKSEFLSDFEKGYIEALPKNRPNVEWIWKEMDRVWDLYGLDNKKPIVEQNIGLFYSHPVWIINGLFTEIDPESKKHRNAIANFINKNGVISVADYGGGSGVLANRIAQDNSNVSVDIVEPFSSSFFIDKLSGVSRVKYIPCFSNSKYDCVIAQDVLEHVDSPIEIAYEISCSVKDNGFVVFANCFYPVIKCHLPHTFYLRHTFKYIMKKMGLCYVGVIPGAEHAIVFKKTGGLYLEDALDYANKMKKIGPVLNYFFILASKLKSFFK